MRFLLLFPLPRRSGANIPASGYRRNRRATMPCRADAGDTQNDLHPQIHSFERNLAVSIRERLVARRAQAHLSSGFPTGFARASLENHQRGLLFVPHEDSRKLGERKTNIMAKTPAQTFPPGVAEELGHYVYRLVDPRNGQTFYVGKGQGNRVFQHAAAVDPSAWDLSATERKEDDLDTLSAKIRMIREIKNVGLEVLPIIHRHGMSEREAFEVEAALIDAYPGLANIQNGHGSADRGCMSVAQILRDTTATEADFGKRKLLIIKIRTSVILAKGGIYEAVRSSWRINEKKAGGLPVLAVENGIIRDVFKATWRISGEGPRKEFDGSPIPDDWARSLVGKRIPKKYRGRAEAYPIRYVNCKSVKTQTQP